MTTKPVYPIRINLHNSPRHHLKQSKQDHNLLATVQCSRRWSTVSTPRHTTLSNYNFSSHPKVVNFQNLTESSCPPKKDFFISKQIIIKMQPWYTRSLQEKRQKKIKLFFMEPSHTKMLFPSYSPPQSAS